MTYIMLIHRMVKSVAGRAREASMWRLALTACLALMAGAVHDASGQCEPEILGSVEMPPDSFTGAIAVSDNLAYVAYWATGVPGVQVIDVSDPTDPVLLGSVETPDSPVDVAAASGVACVVSNSGLHVIDVSNPADPVLRGSVEMGVWPRHVAVSGTVAYVSDGLDGSLISVDVSDPTNPVVLGSFNSTNIEGIAISGTTAYTHAYGANNLLALDVSDPANMVIIGWVDYGQPVTTDPDGHPFAVSGDRACVLGGVQVFVIDISDPTHMTMDGIVWTPGTQVRVAMSGTLAYVWEGNQDLHVVDVSDPTNPVIIGSMELSSSGIAASGTVVYNSAYEMATIDVSSCHVSCPADLDSDGSVGVTDLLTVLGAWGTPDGDVTGDRMTDVADVLAVLAHWGSCE